MNYRSIAFAILRFLGVLLGLVLTLGMIGEIAGVAPHSMEMPPLSQRVQHALPALIAGIVLLIPHRLVTSRATLVALALAYGCILLAVAYKSASGMRGVAAGNLDGMVIPVSLAILTIVAGNLFALSQRRVAAT